MVAFVQFLVILYFRLVGPSLQCKSFLLFVDNVLLTTVRVYDLNFAGASEHEVHATNRALVTSIIFSLRHVPLLYDLFVGLVSLEAQTEQKGF